MKGKGEDKSGEPFSYSSDFSSHIADGCSKTIAVDHLSSPQYHFEICDGDIYAVHTYIHTYIAPLTILILCFLVPARACEFRNERQGEERKQVTCKGLLTMIPSFASIIEVSLTYIAPSIILRSFNLP